MKIYGRNSLVERLRVNPQSIKSIYIEKGVALPQDIECICKAQHIPRRRITEKEFGRISRNIRTQGIITEIEEFRYADLEDIINQPKEKLPALLFLDNLNDPQNLGSILRSAAGFGGFAVVLPKHNSVEVTEAVLRVAAGGENYVPVSQVTNLSQAIEIAKKRGYWIAGAAVEGGENLTSRSLNFPLGLVIGSEAKGIRQGLIRHLDFKFTIPMGLAKLSFNSATATAIFCYEAVRQRKNDPATFTKVVG